MRAAPTPMQLQSEPQEINLRCIRERNLPLNLLNERTFPTATGFVNEVRVNTGENERSRLPCVVVALTIARQRLRFCHRLQRPATRRGGWKGGDSQACKALYENGSKITETWVLIDEHLNVAYVYSIAEIAGQLSDTILREIPYGVNCPKSKCNCTPEDCKGYLSAGD